MYAVPTKEALIEKELPKSTPPVWTLGQRQLFWKVTPRKRSFWWGKKLAGNDREKGELDPWGDTRQVGDAKSR